MMDSLIEGGVITEFIILDQIHEIDMIEFTIN